jgi:hypothetical protein
VEILEAVEDLLEVLLLVALGSVGGRRPGVGVKVLHFEYNNNKGNWKPAE